MSEKTRYAIVGTGGRSRMFIDGIYERYAEHAELVGLCDLSPTRMAYWNKYISTTYQAEKLPQFAPDEFETMIQQTRADVVIVVTTDCMHHEYIIRAMDAGCDAITEKPMTIDEEKAAAILDAIERTGKKLRVTFNYRYVPVMSKLREVVASGEIGTPTLVDYQWRLDTSHGADYFRRWHREKNKSGGLLVHKSTHHFDLINWILDSMPRRVFAFGKLAFYGEKNAAARGESYPYARYTGESQAENDPFALFLNGHDANQELKELYKAAEADSGYIRDRNVFGGEDQWPITAEDTMSVNVTYDNGTIMNYSLIAYCPWEGERIAITGTKGQIEYFGRGKGHIIAGQSDEELAAAQYRGERYIRLQKMFEEPQELEVPEAQGGHGGGDAVLLDRIFLPNPAPDPLKRDASHIDGAASILLGIAANKSIDTGQPIDVEPLLPQVFQR